MTAIIIQINFIMCEPGNFCDCSHDMLLVQAIKQTVTVSVTQCRKVFQQEFNMDLVLLMWDTWIKRYWPQCIHVFIVLCFLKSWAPFVNMDHDDIIKWKHFLLLLALCTRNSLITGEFPSQRPVTWSFDVVFDLHLNERLSKELKRWWFEMPSCSLWCHCNVILILIGLSNHMPSKMWDEIKLLVNFQTSMAALLNVWEGMSNFIPYF